jgi:CRISPR-associated exonuclease Cas4
MNPDRVAMLTVGELKQFVYCQRIFYYLSVQGLRPPATGLMERGRRLQEEFERLEPRRVLSRYGMEDARRYFSLSLTDPGLHLGGQTDLLLEAADRLAVVEFKASDAPLAENHRIQLTAYAMLAERQFLKPCPAAFALFVDREEVEEIPIDSRLRDAVNGILNNMRGLLRDQVFPPPAPVRARCTHCEFRNFCGDVF